MSGLGFHALSAAVLFALAAPVILFYFLKLRRPRVQVPSLLLWRQAIRDQRVNSPFQRFKRNILLFLQLLLLALVVLAAMQPYWMAPHEQVERRPVLIDCSASMGAREQPGGPTRLDLAREAVRGLIDGLGPDQELCLIAFSDRARRLTDFVDNRRVLHDAVDKLSVQDVPADLEEGLRVAEAMARSAPFDTAVLVSDGNLPGRAGVNLSYRVEFSKLPPGGANLGITALQARREPGESWSVFARVEASAPASGRVELYAEEQLIATEYVSVQPDQAGRVVFRLGWTRTADLRVQVAPEGFDALASDNVAFLSLPATRALTVYCPADLAAVRHALAVQTGLRVLPEEEEEGGPRQGLYDLVISDRAEDRDLPARVALYLGQVPEELEGLVTVDHAAAEVVDWRREALILRHVDLTDLLLFDRPRSAQGARETDYEARGFSVLVHGPEGPLLLEERAVPSVRYYALFHPDRSTLPFRVGFPVLVANLVAEARRAAGLGEANAAATGVLPAQKLEPEAAYTVTGPQGETREVMASERGLVEGVPAPQVGVYTLTRGPVQAGKVGAALLSAEETRLEPVDRLEVGETAVRAQAGTLETDKPLWALLLALGVGVLLVEWWTFHRPPVRAG